MKPLLLEIGTIMPKEIINFIQFADVAGTTRDIDNAAPENRTVQSTIGKEKKELPSFPVGFSWSEWDPITSL